VLVEQKVKEAYRPDEVPADLDLFEELIYRIVRFRRGHSTAGDWEIFEALVIDNQHRLKELNGRWLVSIANRSPISGAKPPRRVSPCWRRLSTL
jgi:hypothetical protein